MIIIVIAFRCKSHNVTCFVLCVLYVFQTYVGFVVTTRVSHDVFQLQWVVNKSIVNKFYTFFVSLVFVLFFQEKGSSCYRLGCLFYLN